MCGIVGYIGYKQAQPILLRSLKRLEYRGYDSCGIAITDGGSIKLFKDVGRIIELERKLPRVIGKTGVGHTRWATHGEPSQINAHPHLDCRQKIAVVHNGIIENFLSLKQQLTQEGHSFLSETDTEVVPHLIEKYYQGNLYQAVSRAIEHLTGSFAIAVLSTTSPELIVARRESPVVIGLGDKENFIASDIPAVLDYTDRVIYLEDDDLALITANEVKIIHQGQPTTRSWQVIPWSLEEAEKAGYEHFMLKEIHEQPQVIRQTLSTYVPETGTITDLDIPNDDKEPNILCLGCGTSFYACLVYEYILNKLGHLGIKSQIASEFIHSTGIKKGTWVIGITQSGETADTLKALKKAKEQGGRTLAITNVIGSSVTRLADHILYIRAGPEISVAATKSFVAQLVIGYLIALTIASVDSYVKEKILNQLRLVSLRVKQILDEENQIAQIATPLSRCDNLFLIARGINYPVALEGALKLKEIAYIHAEAYSAGELKHGPFALLRNNTPVIAITAPDDTYQSMLTSVKEVKARNSPVIAIAQRGDKDIEQVADEVIFVPEVDPLLSPITSTIVLQLLAYYAAKVRGNSIDFPVNLAKSVTVP